VISLSNSVARAVDRRAFTRIAGTLHGYAGSGAAWTQPSEQLRAGRRYRLLIGAARILETSRQRLNSSWGAVISGTRSETFIFFVVAVGTGLAVGCAIGLASR
jgi:hypothetical protein